MREVRRRRRLFWTLRRSEKEGNFPSQGMYIEHVRNDVIDRKFSSTLYWEISQEMYIEHVRNDVINRKFPSTLNWEIS